MVRNYAADIAANQTASAMGTPYRQSTLPSITTTMLPCFGGNLSKGSLVRPRAGYLRAK